LVNVQNQFATIGDFDGDGIADILTLLQNCNSSDISKLVLIKPNKTTIAERACLVVDSYFTASQPNSLFAATNIDADGKQEVILRFKNPYGYDKRQVTGIKLSPTSTPAAPKFQLESLPNFDKTYDASLGNFKLGDFNGDGNTDIVYKNTTANSVYYEFSTGKNYVTGATIVFPSNMEDWDVGDFNGDGITDIVCSYKNCIYYYPYPQCITRPEGCGNGTNCTLYFDVYYGTGNGFQKRTYSDPYYDSSNGNNNSGKLIIGDFNGDGKSDIFSNQSNYFNTYSFNPNGNDFLLERVMNGFQQTTQVNYKSLTEQGTHYVRTIASSYPLNITKAAIKVVTSVITPNGIGGTTIVNYKYENAFLHRGGLGFLGFNKVQIDNPIQNAQTITEIEILTPQYVPAVKTVTNNQVVNGTTTLLSQATNTNSIAVNGTRYWLKIDATASNNALTGATSSSTSTYDDTNGNITFTGTNINNEEYAFAWYNWEGFVEHSLLLTTAEGIKKR
jgi:Insecticide toxin TcdB middle/N-terminal region